MDNTSQDDNHRFRNLEPGRDILVQQPLGFGLPNQPIPPLDHGQRSGCTTPWSTPSETRRPPFFKQESRPISPLFYDTPPGDPPSSPSQKPSSYHPSPMKPAQKQRAQVDERATPSKTVYKLGSGYATSEEEEQPEEGLFTRAWLPPRQSPEETLTQFQARLHQYHLNRDERSLFRPPVKVRRSTHIPVSRVLPDNAYGNRPPIEIKQDLQQGLNAI